MATPKVKDWDAVEAYFDYGLDTQHRRVFMLGDFEEDIVANVIKSIYFLAGQSDEKIELYVSSFGGSEYEMLGLFDVMQSVPNVIQTIAVGKCMSAGPLVVAGGSPGERWSMPNTKWMVHMGGVDVEETRPEAVAAVSRHNSKLASQWYELMAEFTGTSAATWKRMCAKVGDTYFDTERALDLGIIDHIWGSEK